MNLPIQHLQDYFERQTFGVCTWWGNKLGIKTQSIRLSFIYLSFITFGSTLFLYLIMAFVLEHKDLFSLTPKKRRSIWELD